MGVPQRPLSPHLGIYRWQLTMALSIFHRLTGVFLSIGAVLIVIVLASIASGPNEFVLVQEWISHPFGQILLVAWTFSLFLHLANGVRHLFWDAGLGFEKSTANATGVWVVLISVAATVAVWVLAWGELL